MLSVIQALVAGLFALSGAWFGATLALNRFRRERAFERQLDWYERVSRSLMEVSRLITSVTIAGEREDDNEAARFWEEAKPSWKRLFEIQAEAPLYASQAGYDALTDLSQRISDAVINQPRPVDTRMASELMVAVVVAETAITGECRKVLGWEPITIRPLAPTDSDR